jgi:hypothetical protein
MFRIIKYLGYAAIVGLIVFMYWFLPKYSFIQKNPGYCVPLSEHFYYCGTDANMQGMFNE